MSERKPPGVTWESWVDRQIREAQDRGEFDDLPGAGEPIPGVDGPRDDLWWLKAKLRRENVSVPLPPSLQLRKDADEALESIHALDSEDAVRSLVERLNQQIRRANATVVQGPPTTLMPFDVETIVERWREAAPGRDPRERA